MNSSPTILQVLPSLSSGGVERGTLEIARAITETGWGSLVASEGGSLTKQLQEEGSIHITLPLASKNPATILANAYHVSRLIRKHSVSLIHARSRAPAWSAFLASRYTGIPFVTTFHGTYGLKPWPKQFYNSVMVKGDRIIAISDFIHHHIKAHYHADENIIRTVPRGVDLDYFSPGAVSESRIDYLASRWEINRNLPLLLLPGRLTRWKGQDVFIKALANLSHRNFAAIIAGDDKDHSDYRKELENLIRKHQLNPQLRIVPHASDMPAALALADIVISASTAPEAFGRIPIEAQAMERPIIATNHGGARETIINNETGWLVKPGSPELLAGALEHALKLNKESRNTIGRHGRLHVEGHFSLQQMQQKTLDVYRELLSIA